MMRNLALASMAILGLTVAACSPGASTSTTETTTTANTTVSTTAVEPTSPADMEAAIARHVTAVKAGDIPGVMADYADDAVLSMPPGVVTPTGTFVGKAEVQKFFEWLYTPEVHPAAQSMVTTNEIVGPNTLLFRWTQFPGTDKEVKGYDVFVFKGGKIVFQMTAPMPG